MHVLAVAHLSSASCKFCLYHLSDYAKGFGGKYGVQKDRMDKVRSGGVVGMFFRGPLAHNTGGLTSGVCHSMVLGALHTSCSTLCVRFVSPFGLRQVSQGPGHSRVVSSGDLSWSPHLMQGSWGCVTV